MSEQKNRMNNQLDSIRRANDLLSAGDKAGAIYHLESVMLFLDADINEKEQQRERIANQIARLRVDVAELRKAGAL